MKWFALLLLPFLGGCLSSTHSLQDISPLSPEGVPASAVSASVQTYAGGQSLSLLDGEELKGVIDAALIEEEIDDETLEDSFLLAGVDEDPPEHEGETVVPEVSFDFPVVENDKVRYYIDYFTGNGRKFFARWLERSSRYQPLIHEVLAEEGLPLDLLYLAMIESGFNNTAYSWAHAAGPWQFITSTGRMYGLQGDWWWDERRDPVKATRAAARHLKDLYQIFDDWYLAAAAYNAGSGKIRRAIQMYDTRDFWEMSHGSYLAKETKNYVPKMLAAMIIGKQPEKYGFTDLAYQSPLAYDVVTVPTSTDLEIVAELCEVPYEEIKRLNPELKRWCTPPGFKDYQVRIPPGSGENFSQRFSLIPENKRIKYRHHRVEKGDTLGGLAKRYQIRVDDIVTINKISNPKSLRIGSDLILPLAGRMVGGVAPIAELKEPNRPSQGHTYKVRKGDSLSTIANRHNISEKDLRNWNKLGGKSTIKVGQVLIVSQRTAQKVPASTPRQAATNSQTTSYKVQSGDTLRTVARKFDVSEKELREWNRLGQKDLLRTGQTLKIVAKAGTPAPSTKKKADTAQRIVYQVQAGDSLWAISRKFDVPARQIMDWNNLGEQHILRPGDRLTILVRQQG